MALTGYSKGNHNYQEAWANRILDPTVCDGDDTTGLNPGPDSPPEAMTAWVDCGTSILATGFRLVVGYENVATWILEGSVNTSSWSATGMSLPTLPSHGGVFSTEIVTLSGLAVNDQYFRLSLSDDGSVSLNGHCAIYEIQPAFPLDAVYSLVSDTTGTASALPNFNNSGGVVASDTGAGSVCIRMDLGSVQAISEIVGAVAFSYTPSEIWKWSTDDITYTAFTPTLTNAYSPGGGVFTTVDQVWTPASTIMARFLRYTMTDTGSGSQVATPGVITLAANNPPATSGGGGLTLSGTITGAGAPGAFSNSFVSIVYKTGLGFSIKNDLVLNPNTQGRYCSDGDLQVAVVTTGCSGAWTWTAPGGAVTAGIRTVKVYLGPMRINPNFNSQDLSGRDADGVPNAQYIVYDTSHREWAETAGTGFGGDAPFGTTTLVSGVWNPGAGPQALYSDVSVGGCCSANGQGVDFGQDSYGAQSAVGYLLAQFAGAYSGCNGFTYVTGTFVFSTSLTGSGRHVWLAIKGPGGIYYNLTDKGDSTGLPAHATATITDACGNSGPITFSGPGAFAFMPANVDWWQVSTVTGVSVNPTYDCSNLQLLSIVPTDVIQISPTNQIHSPVEHDRILDGTNNGKTGTGTQGLLIIVRDCTANTPGVQMQADTFDGDLNVAWVSSGALKTAVHLGPQLQIGTSTVGWQATQTVEATNVNACGIYYMPNGRLVLAYSLSNQSTRRTNDKRGTGVAGDWSAAASFSVGMVSAAGRGQQQSWVMTGGSSDQAGLINFFQARDNKGAALTSAVQAIGGSTKGPLCGGAWLGNGYGALYTRFSDSEVLWTTTPNPDDWVTSAATVDTTFTGNVCGLARHPSGRLIGLTQASAGGAVHAVISDDRGLTWAQSSALGITPTIPPVIVCIGAVLYAVYISSDAPHFVASVDGGATWN